jgi:hypothetical protein
MLYMFGISLLFVIKKTLYIYFFKKLIVYSCWDVCLTAKVIYMQLKQKNSN